MQTSLTKTLKLRTGKLMLIKKFCPLTNQYNTLDLPITPEQFYRIEKRNATEYIQNIAPNLTADQREFLITGILPDTWDVLFNETNQDNQ